jgi:hypothetical protein
MQKVKHNYINNRNIKSENYAQNAQKDIPNKNALVHNNIFYVFALSFSLFFFSFFSRAEEPLVKNGGFEKVDSDDATKPLGWEKPDGLGVQWINEKGRGKVICMDTSVTENALEAQRKKRGITDWRNPKPSNSPVAAFYGLSFYSILFKVIPGQAYRISFDFKAFKASGGGKLWVRGYGMFGGRMRRRYETYIPCRTKNSEWKHISQCFHPTANTKGVTEMKIMLFAYWPPGKYYFDNIKIVPVSNEEYKKDKNQNVIRKK